MAAFQSSMFDIWLEFLDLLNNRLTKDAAGFLHFLQKKQQNKQKLEFAYKKKKNSRRPVFYSGPKYKQ